MTIPAGLPPYWSEPLEYECLAKVQGWFNYRNHYRQVAAQLPDGGHVVEVGCWLGRSICYLALECQRLGKKVLIDAVDPWPHQDVYRHFLANVAGCGVQDLVRLHRAWSPAAAAAYGPGSLDHVFIDGAHDYDSVKADLLAWLPKVRPGCWLAGHDYVNDWPGVVRAVDEIIPAEALTRDRDGWVWAYQIPTAEPDQ